jgi:hypothetical protein
MKVQNTNPRRSLKTKSDKKSSVSKDNSWESFVSAAALTRCKIAQTSINRDGVCVLNER